jgi:hypothetical protein
MRLDFDVDATGPVFDGRAAAIIEAYRLRLTDVLGDMAVARIRAYLPTQYMYLGNNDGTPELNPVPPDAGALAASVHTERATDDANLVIGDAVTYGAWIEGVADENLIIWPHRRNPPPRRFPGYHTFRKIGDQLQHEVKDIATRELQPYIIELNT